MSYSIERTQVREIIPNDEKGTNVLMVEFEKRGGGKVIVPLPESQLRKKEGGAYKVCDKSLCSKVRSAIQSR